VCDGPEPIAVRQDLLRHRDETRAAADQEPDRRHEVVRAHIFGIGLVEVEPGIAPGDRYEWRSWTASRFRFVET
jgi:hypothetical protein